MSSNSHFGSTAFLQGQRGSGWVIRASYWHFDVAAGESKVAAWRSGCAVAKKNVVAMG